MEEKTITSKTSDMVTKAIEVKKFLYNLNSSLLDMLDHSKLGSASITPTKKEGLLISRENNGVIETLEWKITSAGSRNTSPARHSK